MTKEPVIANVFDRFYATIKNEGQLEAFLTPYVLDFKIDGPRLVLRKDKDVLILDCTLPIPSKYLRGEINAYFKYPENI